jgi:hypothetical protein
MAQLKAVTRKVAKIKRMLNRGITPARSSFFNVGFHGDRYLLQLVDLIIHNCDYFVETGTNVGSTLAYVARTYPYVQCLSCEPDSQAFESARENTSGLDNVSIYNETSQQFQYRLQEEHVGLFREDVLFWLDAHGCGFKWPLKEELRFITTEFDSAYILIDDFKVPGSDHFNYDEYQDQICSYDYVKDALAPGRQYRLYYPNYTERTSKHHDLRGWGLIEFGHIDELEIPELLLDKVLRLQ